MGHMRRLYKGRHHAWCIRTLVRRDGSDCGVCGEPIQRMQDMTIDHKVAFSRGGSDGIENLQLAHSHCNQAKGNLSSDEWAALQGTSEAMA